LSHFSGLSEEWLHTKFKELAAREWQPQRPMALWQCRRRAACSKEVEPDAVKPDADYGEMLVKGQAIATPPDTFKLNM